MEVLIIGKSLSGLAFALACARRGLRTCVLERKQGERRGGATLGVDRDLLLRVTGISGNQLDAVPFPALTGYRKALPWQSLWSWLCAHALQCDAITLIDGVRVLEVIQGADRASAIVQDGRSISAEVIIGADGCRSVVRATVDPQRPDALYAGYLLWRGLVHEADLPADVQFPPHDDGVALKSAAGDRLIAYPVAGPDGSLHRGERSISFAWYDARRTDLLRNLHCLTKTGHVLRSPVPRLIPRSTVQHLRDLAGWMWPRPWRTAVLQALEQGGFVVTPVVEYYPERLQRGRVAIIGDAAHVVSPVTGKGFRTGLADAETLANCLALSRSSQAEDLETVLRCYEEKRLPPAQSLATESMLWSREFVRRFPL